MKMLKIIAFEALLFISMCNIAIAQGLQGIKSMDSAFVTGYLIGDDKSVIFYSTKDPVFNIAILRKKKNDGGFIKYIDPIDIKKFMGLDKYNELNLIDNPLKHVANSLFRIKFRNKVYTIFYLNQYMMEVKATGYKGEKLEFITFPFYRS